MITIAKYHISIGIGCFVPQISAIGILVDLHIGATLYFSGYLLSQHPLSTTVAFSIIDYQTSFLYFFVLEWSYHQALKVLICWLPTLFKDRAVPIIGSAIISAVDM